MTRSHFWVSDRQFAQLAPHLPTDTRGVPRVDGAVSPGSVSS